MKGEKLPSDQETLAKDLEKSGGPGPDIAMPIRIVGHGEMK
jgi:hypothetical protein